MGAGVELREQPETLAGFVAFELIVQPSERDRVVLTVTTGAEEQSSRVFLHIGNRVSSNRVWSQATNPRKLTNQRGETVWNCSCTRKRTAKLSRITTNNIRLQISRHRPNRFNGNGEGGVHEDEVQGLLSFQVRVA